MLNIHDTIIANQLAASNPNVNVWVNASAGSGKTKVLIDRMLRLLLQNVSPSSIVCLTFTQAAVSEMQHRLQSYLEQWVLSSDDVLIQQIQLLDPTLNITSSLLLKARALFNQVLDEPVQIQTIHSFAQHILLGSPIENDIPFGVRLMDDVNTKRLIQLAIQEVFEIEAKGGKLDEVYSVFSSSKLNDIIHKIVDEQAFFRFIFIDGIEAFHQRLIEYLANPRPKNEILNEVEEVLGNLNLSRLNDIVDTSDNDKQWISSLLNAIQLKHFPTLIDLLLTDKGTPRKRLLSKKITDLFPDLTFKLHDLAQQVFNWEQELKKGKAIETTLLVVKVADVFLKHYSQLKNDQGVLDYDDLIFKTLELLSDTEKSATILYRLDRSICHLLVDEAQDTNLFQWKLIDLIVNEFFQSSEHKTLFVVGDHKQSIFGFQGTDPDIFQQIKLYYHDKASLRTWQDVSLDISFRSLQSILDFIDSIFEGERLISSYTKHTAFQKGDGKVIVHPLCKLVENTGENTYQQFVEQVVDQINHLIGSPLLHKGTMRPIQPKDILILIRRRGEHLDALQDQLRKHNIPFSAPMRHLMYENELVRFITHTITCLLQPFDEWTIMQWFLNPLLDLSVEGIQGVIHRLDNPDSLKDRLMNHPIFISIMQTVERYTSLEDLYIRLCIWAQHNLSLDSYSIANALTLLSFLQTWEWNNTHITYTHTEFNHHITAIPLSQLNHTTDDGLRILTVHGAKGLQAPIVMLIDTTQLPITRSMWGRDDANNLLLCISKSSEEFVEYQNLKNQQKANELKEYYRLLYVALTRAENELHVFGCAKGKISEESWYALCAAQYSKSSLHK
jgi:ATP-dependent helicase/nuclease subunit A